MRFVCSAFVALAGLRLLEQRALRQAVDGLVLGRRADVEERLLRVLLRRPVVVDVRDERDERRRLGLADEVGVVLGDVDRGLVRGARGGK